MRIFIIGSMQFSEKMLETKQALEKAGHDVKTSNFISTFIGKNSDEKEEIKIDQKNNEDAMVVDCRQILGGDAVLVINLNKNGIENYIGGNTLIELGFAHILRQKVFLLNPIPEIEFYKTELEAMKPIILDGDLTKIK